MKSYVKRTFKVGAWYFNPMMEQHGLFKFRWTRLTKVEDIYDVALSLSFDQGIFPDGSLPHVIRKNRYDDSPFFTQSNGDYEMQMREATGEELKWIETRLRAHKFGL
jgi:hypothetical protein